MTAASSSGVPPTGKYVEVPTVAIVNFRGNKLYHEHIYWDQASVLVQVGLLDATLLPDIAGMDEYTGTAFHSARWNHDVDLTGDLTAVEVRDQTAAGAKQRALPGSGAAGENVTIAGLDWADVRPGVRLRIGEVLAEVWSFASTTWSPGVAAVIGMVSVGENAVMFVKDRKR